MGKLYVWHEDWDRGTILNEIWGDEWETDHSKDFWLPSETTNEELKQLEKLGPLRSKDFIDQLRLKY